MGSPTRSLFFLIALLGSCGAFEAFGEIGGEMAEMGGSELSHVNGDVAETNFGGSYGDETQLDSDNFEKEIEEEEEEEKLIKDIEDNEDTDDDWWKEEETSDSEDQPEFHALDADESNDHDDVDADFDYEFKTTTTPRTPKYVNKVQKIDSDSNSWDTDFNTGVDYSDEGDESNESNESNESWSYHMNGGYVAGIVLVVLLSVGVFILRIYVCTKRIERASTPVVTRTTTLRVLSVTALPRQPPRHGSDTEQLIKPSKAV